MARGQDAFCSTLLWSQEMHRFAEKVCVDLGLVFSARSNVVKTRGGVCIFDSDGMRASIVSAQTSGVAVADLMREYPNAYIDLYALISGDPEMHFDGTQIWHIPARVLSAGGCGGAPEKRRKTNGC